MKLFNEYGVITDSIANELEDNLYNTVSKYFDSLVTQGISPVELRALVAHLSGAIEVAGSESLLRLQMSIRKGNKVQ